MNSSPDIFLDAGASGDDVFFATLSRLTPSDEDTLFDVYDARVNGGAATEAGEPGCQSDCHQAGANEAGGPPLASTSLGPPGNLPALASAPPSKKSEVKCAKNSRLSHGKCVKKKTKSKCRKRRRGRTCKKANARSKKAAASKGGRKRRGTR